MWPQTHRCFFFFFNLSAGTFGNMFQHLFPLCPQKDQLCITGPQDHFTWLPCCRSAQTNTQRVLHLIMVCLVSLCHQAHVTELIHVGLFPSATLWLNSRCTERSGPWSCHTFTTATQRLCSLICNVVVYVGIECQIWNGNETESWWRGSCSRSVTVWVAVVSLVIVSSLITAAIVCK